MASREVGVFDVSEVIAGEEDDSAAASARGCSCVYG